MTPQHQEWPPLPRVDELLVDEPAWAHPGIGAGGVAHLRVWSTRGERRLAVVTDADHGCSVTNAAEHIHAVLVDGHGADVVQLEHYPAAGRTSHTIDQVVVDQLGRPRWRRIWPIVPANPAYPEFLSWICHGGAAVLDTLNGGAR